MASNNDKNTYREKFKTFYEENRDSINKAADDNAARGFSMNRRKFLALMGASAAFAGVNCSDYVDKGEIVPYNKKPEDVLPGTPEYYASTCSACNNGCGILIKTREGRPVKIDGNPDHPVNGEAVCFKAQASIADLYDPARLKEPLRGKDASGTVSWKEADNEITKVLKRDDGREIALIANSNNSPASQKVIEDFIAEYPQANLYNYDFFNDSIKRNAWEKCYGTRNLPSIDWDRAKVIVSFEGDFLGTDDSRVENRKLYSKTRNFENTKDFSRLYAVEGNMSLTGMNADYRMRLRPDAQFEFIMSLMSELVTRRNASVILVEVEVLHLLRRFNLGDVIEKYNLDKEVIDTLINDVLINRGRTIFYAGEVLSEEVHIAVNLMNDILGSSVLYSSDRINVPSSEVTDADEWERLIQQMNAGNVKAVIHLDCNPVYHISPQLKYKEALSNVEMPVMLASLKNETSAHCSFTLPINHYVESWGDAKVRRGLQTLIQPVINPIYNTRQLEAVLLNWIENGEYDTNNFRNYLKDFWRENVYRVVAPAVGFEKFWYAALHNGFVEYNDPVPELKQIDQNVIRYFPGKTADTDRTALLLYKNSRLGDGRFANNGWLQELPHPVSKITWDNYAALSQATALRHSLVTGDMIELDVDGEKVKLPVLIQPGMADDLVAVETGYGRSNSPAVAENVGVDVNRLIRKHNRFSPWFNNDVSIRKIEGSYELASTQDHFDPEDEAVKDIHIDRHIIRFTTLKKFQLDPDVLKHEFELHKYQIYEPHEYPDNKWGMSIDLNKCIGCNECVTACDMENNIPVVGKDQVIAGREMHWIRIDRYYAGSTDNPIASYQPMLCQHCDKAPCENVCPVVATTHSVDGLNQMVYNRCVGTRYCSNNCPYKVRRFNFFNFRDHFENAYYTADSVELMRNPEVTVRSRGVMEKCTFCVQRISQERYDAVAEKREFDSERIKTACQVACPTNAITFGDINKEDNELNKYRKHSLGYYVLEEFNTDPNVTYIAKLRNIQSEEA